MSEYVLKIGGREYRATVEEITADKATIVVDDTSYEVDLVEIGRRAAPAVSVQRPATRPASAPVPSPTPTPRVSAEISGAVPAPLPGLILRIEVKEGDSVQAGQSLLVMEAMKMENVVPAPHNGTVRKIFVAEGATVGEGEPLIEVARPEMTTL
jgi:biotin carboxyl carrier protein